MGLPFAGRRRLLAIGLVGALAPVLAAGVALAQQGPSADGEGVTARHRHPGSARLKLAKLGLRDFVRVSGLPAEVVRQGLRDGQTLAQVLEANGKDRAAVSAQLAEDLKTGVARALANGRLTEAQASAITTRADEIVATFLDARHPLRKAVVRAGLAEVVETSGLAPEVVRQGLKDGKSLNEILAENGKDPAAVQAQVLAELDAKLDEAVANQAITQERADAIASRAAERLPRLMEREPAPGHAFKKVLRHERATAASAIGIEAKELAAELKAGKTIAEVSAEHGVSAEAVIEALVADVHARIDQAVADGKLETSRAETLKERAEQAITRFVNDGRRAKEGRGGP
jgi:hypothetical protein